MNEIESLVQAYEQYVRLPWDFLLAGPQKVWFAIYEPSKERRLRLRIDEFEGATKRAKHDWHLVDITDSFSHWMAQHDYKEGYFKHPEEMGLSLDDYAQYLSDILKKELTAGSVNENTLVAICGIGSLFGLTSASSLLEKIAPQIKGRLLVFFPGQRDGSNYRMLDARDGWNYLAVPTSANVGKNQ
jgi:hypothetical protein